MNAVSKKSTVLLSIITTTINTTIDSISTNDTVKITDGDKNPKGDELQNKSPQIGSYKIDNMPMLNQHPTLKTDFKRWNDLGNPAITIRR